VSFVAKQAGPKRTDTGALAITADLALDELPDPEIVLVPGGEGNRPLLADQEVLDWLRRAHRTSTWTTSVCTGSLVLGAAGILEGKRATSHWVYRDALAEYGATPLAERVVFDGKIVTAAGVASGLDMALALAARLAGDDVAKAIQLGIEYDPEPPFDSGSPEKAAPELVTLIRGLERRGAGPAS
jgi:transcriptional regulator GlxA family with amidase domain